MASQNSTWPIAYELTHTEDAGAGLKVLGLTVQKRTQNQLQDLSVSFADSGKLIVRGDVQYLPKSLQKVLDLIAHNPARSHKFQTPDSKMIPIEWRSEESTQPPLVHTLKISFWMVTDLLVRFSPEQVARKLSQPLLHQIYDQTEGWVARGLNKRISFALTRLLVKTNLKPNHITAMNLLLGLVGCLGLMSASYGWALWGAVLLQMNAVFDACDGEVAKLKGETTILGSWMDAIADDILTNVMFFALVFGIYLETQSSLVYTFGMLSVSASLGVTFFTYYHRIVHRQHGLSDSASPMLKRDNFIFLVLVFSLLGWREMLLIFLVPIWIAFVKQFSSFVYGLFAGQQSLSHGDHGGA